MITVEDDSIMMTKDEFDAMIHKSMQDGYNKAKKEYNDNTKEIIMRAEETIKKLIKERDLSFEEGYKKGLKESHHSTHIDNVLNERIKKFIGNAEINGKLINWLDELSK